MLSRFFHALLAFSTVVGCHQPTEPVLPAGAVSLQPPPAYSLWWELTESCSGLTGELSDVRWYVVPGADQIQIDGEAHHGWSRGNIIVLAERALLVGSLVRHEMLHALTPTEGHTLEYFVSRCGGVVACSGRCATEAGDLPQVPLNAPHIDPADLDVRVQVDSSGVSASVYEGWVAVTVSAANVRPYPVWVRLAPVAAGASASATFGYNICTEMCHVDYSYHFTDADRIGFEAGQVRRLVFDHRLTPGDYTARGFFNSDTAAAVPFTVLP